MSRCLRILIRCLVPFGLSLIMLGWFFAYLQTARVLAATITVDGTTCTLPNAILSANQDTAIGGCASGSGNDVLSLTSSLYQFSAPYGTSNFALPPITSSILIEGNGAVIQRDPSASSSFGIFHIEKGSLTLTNLTVRNGSEFGGIDVEEGSLVLSRTQVISNSGFNGGGIGGFGTLLVAESVIKENEATNIGGGIDFEGTLMIVDSMILSNTASTGGGIVFAHPDQPAQIIRSTIAYNKNGGIATGFKGQIQIINSTISGNDDGLLMGIGDPGRTNTIAITHTTITSNTTAGVVDNDEQCNGCIFTYTSSILSNNGYNGSNWLDCNLGSNFVAVSGGYNVLGKVDSNNCPFVSTDITDTLPLLNPLQANGGKTWTHAPQSNSPAIELVPVNINGCKSSITLDQRGAVRADGVNRGGAKCDSGAYEGDSNQTPTLVGVLSMRGSTPKSFPWRQGLGIGLLFLTLWATHWAVRHRIICGCAK